MKKYLLYIIFTLIVVVSGVWFIWFSHAQKTQPSGKTLIATATYTCDEGKTIAAAYYKGLEAPKPEPGQPPTPTGSVMVSLDGQPEQTLNQTISASGIRYANEDESFVFWSKGVEALIMRNNSMDLTYANCIATLPDPGGLSQVYKDNSRGFILRYPEGYAVDTQYLYTALGPGKYIGGVAFTVPKSATDGTNLASDTHLSVEQMPNVSLCTAKLFLSDQKAGEDITVGYITYSTATATDAGAGNRYEEWVYALPGSDPCTAIRYFIHYNVLENYQTGTVQAFDKAELIKQFGLIRDSITYFSPR